VGERGHGVFLEWVAGELLLYKGYPFSSTYINM
jgi:hypothetical protein